jgi:broad specificity phosphatase PhoE
MKIFFESHATTIDNDAGLASGWNDVDLSEFGYQNINDLRKRYADNPPDVVFCSDLVRAYKTAALAFEGYNVPIIIDRRLRECDFGDFTQHDAKEVKEQRSQRIEVPFPNGESYTDTMNRMGAFLKELRVKKEERVMIIGHRATQYGLEHHLNGKSIKEAVTEPWSWQPGWQYDLI